MTQPWVTEDGLEGTVALSLVSATVSPTAPVDLTNVVVSEGGRVSAGRLAAPLTASNGRSTMAITGVRNTYRSPPVSFTHTPTTVSADLKYNGIAVGPVTLFLNDSSPV